jgi:hypothetical protein
MFTSLAGKLMQRSTQGPKQSRKQSSQGMKILEKVRRLPQEPDPQRAGQNEPLNADGAGEKPGDVYRFIAPVG